MNMHLKYMQWLRERNAIDPSFTTTSRTYKNLAGADELIWLPNSYWDYVDWMEERGDISFADWVIHCEKNPHEDVSISNLLLYWLWQDECSRWMNCQPTPTTKRPAGLKFWKASYGDRVWTAGYAGRTGSY
jgi:hypothetical protein